MNPEQQPTPPTPQSPQPVAYDAEGRPLYHHPPTTAQPAPPPAPKPTPHVSGASSHVTAQPQAYEGSNFNPQIRSQYANEPDVVHATRPLEPTVPEVSDALRRKHEESTRLYPFLNLSEGEFVILSIKRHPIGLMIPVGATTFVLVLLISALVLVPDFYQTSAGTASMAGGLLSMGSLVGIILLLIVLVAIIGGVAIWVYLKNQFFLTNESVIQEIQHGLFSHHEQTVSLGSIEDASYKRQGILQHLFDYGTMRLSTEGEETTYRFAFVEDPKRQIATVNNAVEAFKNGRPVGLEHLDS